MPIRKEGQREKSVFSNIFIKTRLCRCWALIYFFWEGTRVDSLTRIDSGKCGSIRVGYFASTTPSQAGYFEQPQKVSPIRGPFLTVRMRIGAEHLGQAGVS